jgi:aspartate/methionine/tyrosine aminotransferase
LTGIFADFREKREIFKKSAIFTPAQGESMSSKRKIPASGINLFQLIYILIREYEESSGKKALNLSLGNPDLVPPPVVLELTSQFQKKPDLELHTYAEDKNINSFSEGMVRAFSGVDVSAKSHLKTVPIAGIKTASALLPLACGLHLKDRKDFHVVSHLPAYDVIGTWSTSYLGSNRIVWPLLAKDGMRMSRIQLEKALDEAKVSKPDLIFVIRPGNPASCGASRKEWEELIELCLDRGIRLVNDGAYTTLTATGAGATHVSLASVAQNYPELEWAEMFSMSKSFSDPGARLGVMVGSKEFVEDYILVKGNTDSGPVPGLMAGYGELFKDLEMSKKLLDDTYHIYRKRLDYLVPRLKSIGLRPACETTAGFFTLWSTPDQAFGLDLHKESEKRKISRSELFNRLVIEKTGIVGVHFQGAPGSDESFIRYAVCTDVLDPTFQKQFEPAIQSIQPTYV